MVDKSKPAPVPGLIVRAQAAQAVVDRYLNKPLKMGDRDCIHMAALNLRGMGYSNPLKGSRPYAGAVGGLRALREALKRVGGPVDGSLADLLDAMGFERIAVAAALEGDFIGFPADDPWPVALAVCVGNGRAIAYAPDGIAVVGNTAPAIAAWRVEPCR